MTFDQFMEVLVVGAVVVLPALAITMRLALRPIVDAIAKLTENVRTRTDSSSVERPSLQEMRDELRQLQQRVVELQEANAFHQSLFPTTNAPNSDPATARTDDARLEPRDGAV